MPKLLLALLLAGTASLAAAQTLVRQTLPLRSVTLYLDGGDLHHEGTLSLPAGAVEVRVQGLSPYLGSTGLQAEASGAELERLDLLPAAPTAAQTDTLRRLRHETEVLTAEKEFLRANTALAAAPGRWVEDMQRGLAYYSKRVVQVNERLALLEERQRSLGALATASPREVLLRLLVPHASPVRLRLSYRVPTGVTATYWQPTYELRVAEDKLQQLRAVSRALVRNGTGLDWASVPVTLRTASPSNDMSRPRLDPWAVSYGRAGNQGEGNLADFAVKGPGTTGTAGAAGAAPDLGASLRLPVPVTLASAASQTFKLGEYTLPMRLEYLAVPKRDDDVFLVGRVSDWNQVNFLAETATVFYRGTYVGETTLDTRAYTDTLEVALGRDPQVQLTRTKREDFARTSGGREKTHLAYEINVKNTHPYPVRLRLLDQVPVSQEKDIVVKVQEIGGATLDADSGKLTWLVGLGAGASRKFPVAFTVEAPEDKPLNLRRDRTIKSPKFR